MHVAVVGGGIAGVTAMRALTRAGIRVTLIEKTADGLVKGIDRGIGIWPTAWREVERLDAASCLVSSSSLTVPPAAYRSRDGQWLSRASACTSHRYAVHITTHNRLIDSMLSGIQPYTLHLGFHVTDIIQEAGKGFVKGKQYDELLGPFDAVLVSGIGQQCKPSGVHSLSFFSPLPSHELPFETLSEGRRIAVIPFSKDQTIVFATCSTNTPMYTLLDVFHLYNYWHHPIPSLIDAALCKNVPFLYEQPPVSQSQVSARGIIAYIGDAAHSMQHNLAQGATLAIEDAVHAAHVLSNTPPTEISIASAFADYNIRRQARVRACRQITQIANILSLPRNPRLEKIRNDLFLHLPKALNSLCFDQFLRASFGHLGDNTYT